MTHVPHNLYQWLEALENAPATADLTQLLSQITPRDLETLLHAKVNANHEAVVVASGLSVGPGAAQGRIAFSNAAVLRLRTRGEQAILVRHETTPEDLAAIRLAAGVLTTRGGLTAHAAVAARGMGVPCIVGARSLDIDEQAQTITANEIVLHAGDLITLDGATGNVLFGPVLLQSAAAPLALTRLSNLLFGQQKVQVAVNADTPEDARIGMAHGAIGVGLCRTEHMLSAPASVRLLRAAVLAPSRHARDAMLRDLLPLQRDAFKDFFLATAGKSVTVRLLDAPLHEFLPADISDETLADLPNLQMPAAALRRRLESLQEHNPMLGHRGCRLGLSYPEIYDMQIRAVFEAALAVLQETGTVVIPDIMVPLVAYPEEVRLLRQRIDDIAYRVGVRHGVFFARRVGAMIELPRAALQADLLAQECDFLSFGTNDLTQTTLGISRDDSMRFLYDYRRLGIIEHDPFAVLDSQVATLIEWAVERARHVKPHISLIMCGEHAADPSTVAFCARLGIQTLSCSPYRVLPTRLATTQCY